MNDGIKDVKSNGGCKKTAFANEKQALFFIEKLQSTSTREKRPKSAYLCPKCFLWHLTSLDYGDDTVIKELQGKVKNLEATVKKHLDKIKKLEVLLVQKENEISNKAKKIQTLEDKYLKLMKFKGLK